MEPDEDTPAEEAPAEHPFDEQIITAIDRVAYWTPADDEEDDE